jgi:hypothetical protein
MGRIVHRCGSLGICCLGIRKTTSLSEAATPDRINTRKVMLSMLEVRKLNPLTVYHQDQQHHDPSL